MQPRRSRSRQRRGSTWTTIPERLSSSSKLCKMTTRALKIDFGQRFSGKAMAGCWHNVAKHRSRVCSADLAASSEARAVRFAMHRAGSERFENFVRAARRNVYERLGPCGDSLYGFRFSDGND